MMPTAVIFSILQSSPPQALWKDCVTFFVDLLAQRRTFFRELRITSFSSEWIKLGFDHWPLNETVHLNINVKFSVRTLVWSRSSLHKHLIFIVINLHFIFIAKMHRFQSSITHFYVKDIWYTSNWPDHDFYLKWQLLWPFAQQTYLQMLIEHYQGPLNL